MNIVVLEADSIGKDVSYDVLNKYGDVTLYGSTPNEIVYERIKNCDIIIPNKCIIDEGCLSKADNVKLICEAATGYNNIDVNYCAKRKIAVTNVAGYSTDNVAQHTFALLLALCEKLDYYTTCVNSKKYCKGKSFCDVSKPYNELTGKTYGIVGLGAIGKKVANIAKAFGMKVIYYSSSNVKQDVEYEMVSFEELLTRSDVISIHAPLTDKTNGLFDKDAFYKMKDSAILINVARGPIVVEKDLTYALKTGAIAAAGLDVFEKEPLSEESPLFEIEDKDRLLMTPHMAWGSVEARKRLIGEISLNIEAYLNGEKRNRIV